MAEPVNIFITSTATCSRCGNYRQGSWQWRAYWRLLGPWQGCPFNATEESWFYLWRQSLACTVALKVVELLETGNIYQRATAIGDIIMQGLATELSGFDHVKEIRGCGCMIGIELSKPCKSLYTDALKQGLIINVTAESVVRLLPPMIMTDQEAEQVVSILAPLIRDFQ